MSAATEDVKTQVVYMNLEDMIVTGSMQDCK